MTETEEQQRRTSNISGLTVFAGYIFQLTFGFSALALLSLTAATQVWEFPVARTDFGNLGTIFGCNALALYNYYIT